MTSFQYFDIEPILSRNALMTFIISSRGAGKTFSNKKRIIRRFNKHGEKFVFLKRTEEEVKATADGFWDDFVTEKQVFKHVKNRFYIGDRVVNKDEEGNDVEEITWKLFGYSTALSTIAKLKGISPQGVGTILWDEFVPYNGLYLPNEATRLLDVMETVFRMREDGRLIGTANKNENGFYPIFHELGLSKTSDFEDDKIYAFKNGEVVIYSFTNKEYIKAKSKTKLGKVARGTSYYDSMIDNKKTSSFIELVVPKPNRLTGLFAIIVKGEMYNISFMHVSKTQTTGLYIEATKKPFKRIYTTDNSSPTTPKLVGNGFNMLYGYIVSDVARFDSQVSAQRVIEAIISKRC